MTNGVAGHGASASATAQRPPDRPLRPPVAAGATPATADPKVVGADPGLIHFDLAAMPEPAPLPFTLAQWTSVGGLERLVLQPGGTGATATSPVQVQVSRDKAALDPLTGLIRSVHVGSRPATSTPGQVRWQPVSGVWVEVQAPGGDDAVLGYANAVTFDHVLRCVVPFRLTNVPAGAAVEACNVIFDDRGASGMATVHTGNSSITVEVQRGGKVPTPTTTINGRPASVQENTGDGGGPILQIDIQYPDPVVDIVAVGVWNRATVLAMAGGYQAATDPNPDTWPVSPLAGRG
jgi:hypothetical protein